MDIADSERQFERGWDSLREGDHMWERARERKMSRRASFFARQHPGTRWGPFGGKLLFFGANLSLLRVNYHSSLALSNSPENLGMGRGWKSAGKGKKTRKLTDPKIGQKCINCYWDICRVLWFLYKGKHYTLSLLKAISAKGQPVSPLVGKHPLRCF